MGPEIRTAVCGVICGECEYRQECGGCDHVQGRPFWTAFVGAEICPVYACCIRERHFTHCGECPDLLCERFTRYRNPDVGEEEARVRLAMKKARLLARRE